MISFAFTEKNGVFEGVLPRDLEKFVGSSSLVWIDFEAASKEDLEFAKKFVSLHPLTVDDIVNVNKRPKVQEFDDYLFLVVHSIDFDALKILPTELDIVFGKNFVLTFHSKPVKEVSSVKTESLSNQGMFKKSPSFLLYYLLDEIISNFFGVVDKFTEHIDVVETDIFSGKPDNRTLSKLFKLKRSVVSFRRYVSPHREVLNFLYHHENSFLDKERSVYFRDLSDNLIRISEFIDTSRDMISDAFDAYLSVVSNRLNEIMKVLTIIATIILPMSLVTGYFGMNVRFLEYTIFGETGTQWFALFLILLIGAIMFLFVRKNKWI